MAATRFLDPVELSLLTSDVDVPESYWLRESARERLAEWEQALANRAGLTVLAPRDSCG